MNNITASSFILKTLRPFPFPIIIVLLAALVWAIDVSFSPYLIKVIIDRISHKQSSQDIATPAISYVLILLLLECIARLYNYLL